MSLGFRVGQRIGKWKLLEPLGRGGNSEVWKATDGREPIALKLVARRGGSESFKRFAREVEAAAELRSRPGILPVAESYLPSVPSRRDPAWIAMPVATPVREALADGALEDIVGSVCAFAGTLASLATDNVSHRDIKPGNLYFYDGNWVVGDFGLVSLPDAKSLTTERLGPFGYMPDEMFNHAAAADGGPVDVFQLAKTFSVLVTQQPYPPQGQIPAGSSGSLSRFVVHPRLAVLEDLIERCTRRDPDQRPAMDAVAQELSAWLNASSQAQPDLSSVAAEFRAAHSEDIAGSARLDALRHRFEGVFRNAVTRVLRPSREVLTEAGLTPALASRHGFAEAVNRPWHPDSTPSLRGDQRWLVADYGRPWRPNHIVIGLGCVLDVEGGFWCNAHLAAGDMRAGGDVRRWYFEPRLLPIENSMAIEEAFDTLGGEILQVLGGALAQLAQERQGAASNGVDETSP